MRNAGFPPVADSEWLRDKGIEGDRLIQRHVALLRGINVGGHRKVPMADLRALAEAAGYRGTKTYVASGNLILESDEDGSAIEVKLEEAITREFGFPVDVIVRSRQRWSHYARCNPLSAESSASPNLVMICVGKEAATDDDLNFLRARAGDNEKVERVDDALWLYFGDGSARSKLGNGRSGKVWTTRTWTTVERLAEMLSASE